MQRPLLSPEAHQCHLVGGTIPHQIPSVHTGTQPPMLGDSGPQNAFTTGLTAMNLRNDPTIPFRN